MSDPVDAQPQGALDILADLAREASDGPTDSEKLDFLYQTAVKVHNLISKVTEDDVQKARTTLRNPLVRKMLNL